MSGIEFRPIRPLLPLLLVLGAILVAGGAFAADSRVVYEGGHAPADFSWEKAPDGSLRPVLAGARTLAQPGLPELPARELLFLIPLDQDVTDVVIEPLAVRREALAAPLARAGDLATSDETLVKSRLLEEVDGAFPAAWGRFGGTHVWRGYRLLAVTVYPVRQVAGNDGVALEYLDEFAVRARFTAATDLDGVVQRQRRVAGEAADTARILTRLVANPETVAGYRREHGQVVVEKSGGFQPSRTPSMTGSGVDYLIITSETLKPTFQILADFKTSQGIPTVVVSREEIAAGNRNGADIQETMRMFIRDSYMLWGVQNVLLGGDSDVLPPRYINNTFYPTVGYTSIPCDLYFACLDGNWNADGDSEFGEPENLPSVVGDLVDFAEEVYIGRAPVTTVDQAVNFVNKTINYERTAAGAQWTNRALFAAEVLFPEDFHIQQYIILDGARFSDQQVNDFIVPCTDMEYLRMYETDWENPRDLPLTRATLTDTLNTGHYGIFNQIGHGYYFNMSVGDGNFLTTDADNLVNGDHTFVLYALNCASAAFDNSCLMERFIQNPFGGSVISIGSVRAAFPNNANNYQQNFFNELYCGTERRAGALLAMSRLPYIGLTDDNYVDRWTFENYTLLGDPTIALWSGSPRSVALGGTAAVNPGPQTVVYTVTDTGLPVEGARVCVRKGDEDYAVGTTDAAGIVSLDILPVSPGNLDVTITGRNVELTELTVPVVASASYLALSSMGVADDGSGGSAGNANGAVEAGETLALSAVFQETGGSPETGLNAVLTCDHPSVAILSGSVAVGSVTAGGSQAAAAPFVVQLGGDIVDGARLGFDIELTGASGTYQTRWEVVCRNVEPEVVSLDWDDSVFGNGDGFLADGERLVIDVDLKNFGGALLDFVDARLRTSSINVVIYDSVATWSNLALMEEAPASAFFSLSVTQFSKAAPMWLLLTDNHGRTVRHDFSLPRPAAPLQIYTDTSLGADVIALAWTPSTSADIYGYNVYRSEFAGGPFVRVNEDVIAGTSYFRDEGLSLLTRYYYQVAAVDSSRVPSVPSAVIAQSTAPAEAEGFPVQFSDETSSHLAVGDVDGDGDKEIILATSQVYIWHHDGLELLDGDSDSQTLGPFTDFAAGTLLNPAGIALANLDGVPGMEIIVSERDPLEQIHVFRKDGTELPGWPRSMTGVPGSKWNWATPAVGDIDGDGEDEIVVNTLNGRVWAWNADGTEVNDGDANPATIGVLYVRAGADFEWSRSGPALCDLDGDSAMDIVFGTKNDSTGLRRIMAIHWDGSDVAGFPYVAQGPINGDPAIGDIDGDGDWEIVAYDRFGRVYVVHHDGTDYPGFPKATGVTASDAWVGCPALGDMDGDGMLEIVYTPNQTGLSSKLIIMDTDYAGGTSGSYLSGFPVDLPGSSEGSPILADIDGDASPDILHGIGGGDESAPYNLYAYHADGTLIDGFPITLTGPLMPSVTVTDIDNDLDVDIVYGGWDFLTHVWDMPFAYDRSNTPWPTFGAGAKRDRVHFPIALVGVEEDQVPAKGFTFSRPYPNPFNPSTRVRLYIPAGDHLELGVYDVAGRLVRTLHTGSIGAGWHTLVWDGRDDRGRGQASGVYFMRARSGDKSAIQKMTLVK
ncbi:VCBS repeat-containing protein [bacterium]|nr:VCBS repeat-containing protein [bacterium]